MKWEGDKIVLYTFFAMVILFIVWVVVTVIQYLIP